MEALLKKYFWVIQTLGIAVACGLAASAVTTQLGAFFLFDRDLGADEGEGETDGEGDTDGDDEGADDTPNPNTRAGRLAAQRKKGNKGFSFDGSAFGGGVRSSKERNKEEVSEAIRKRNIFCPTCVDEAETTEPQPGDVDASGRPSGPVLSPGETKSKLPLRLMATMEAEDPDSSLATILDEEAGVAGLFGRGDLIRRGVVVMSVGPSVVHLRNNAALEYIELGDEPPPVPQSSSTSTMVPSVPAQPPKNDRVIEGAAEAINCPTEHTCTIERAFVEGLMANPVKLAKQARIVPKQRDDEILGYKLYGIRRGSLPKLLGLKNGDMLTAVNGEELKSMDKAMALYTKLRRASNLSVSIERKGKTITKEFQIQ